MKGKIFVKLNKVMETLNLSATQIKRLSEDNKVVRYRRKDDDTLSWEYDDESIYAYKQYLEEKARLDHKYNNTKYVIKRDKTHAEFDKSKITSAITKAFMDVYSETQNVSQMIEKVTDLSVNKLLRSGRAEYDITDIQSAVESALVDAQEYEVARAYTDYRLEHDIARWQQTSIDYQVERLFAKDDDIVNENANKDSDVYATLRDLKAGAVDKVIGLKPVETGSETFGENLEGSDSFVFAEITGRRVEDVNRYFFTKPMSPHIAAELDGIDIDIKEIKALIDKNLMENEIVVVEGAGGLLVPYKNNYTFLDLLVDYRQKSEVVVVAPNVLGTINHTLMTIDVLKRNDIKISEVILNNIDKTIDKEMLKSNREAIENFTTIKNIRELD